MLNSFEKAAARSPLHTDAHPVPLSAGPGRPQRAGRALAGAVLAAALAACGGGGGSSGSSTGGIPVNTPTNFPLGSAYAAFIRDGIPQGKQFTLTATGTTSATGTCNGTAVIAAEAAHDAVFEGQAAKVAVNSTTLDLPNCSARDASGAVIPLAGRSVSQLYYDTGFNALGSVDIQGYSRYQSAAGASGALQAVTMPSFVSVGQSGTLGTAYVYTDTTRSTLLGRIVLSYDVQADPAPTATDSSVLVRLTTATYNNVSASPVSTQVTTYRLGSFATLVPIRSEIDFPTFQPGLHLTLVAQ